MQAHDATDSALELGSCSRERRNDVENDWRRSSRCSSRPDPIDPCTSCAAPWRRKSSPTPAFSPTCLLFTKIARTAPSAHRPPVVHIYRALPLVLCALVVILLAAYLGSRLGDEEGLIPVLSGDGKSLVSVTLPNSLITIGDHAFRKCSSWSSVGAVLLVEASDEAYRGAACAIVGVKITTLRPPFASGEEPKTSATEHRFAVAAPGGPVRLPREAASSQPNPKARRGLSLPLPLPQP